MAILFTMPYPLTKFTKEMYIKLITLQYERHLFYPYLFLEYPQLPYYISVWQLLVDICTSTKYIYICSLLSSIQGSPKNKRLNFYFYLLFRVHLRVKVKVHLYFFTQFRVHLRIKVTCLPVI